MKVVAILMLWVVCFSCSKDSQETESTDIFGKWQLVRMTESWSNSETMGSEMAWQEYFQFQPDSTFTKTREQKGTEINATGVFSLKKNAHGDAFLQLTYRSEGIIAGSCHGAPKEELHIASPTKLESQWRDCDGPGLEYQKVGF